MDPKPVSLALLLAAPLVAGADEADARANWMPDGMFLQMGHAPRTDTQALGLGLVWPGAWQWRWLGGRLSLYWEVAMGRWSTRIDAERRSQWVSQFSLTPTLRWSRQADAGWFYEFGIGANLITPIYQAEQRRFSTTFNFGDHLGMGYRWSGGSHELALRVQHFSNAGIRRPNPGEDFVQLRWVYAL